MGRLVIVSNRVASITPGKASTGGLAVGIGDVLGKAGGLWFGWNGETSPQSPEQVQVTEHGNITLATIGLSRKDYEQYYLGFSNNVLWPAFHYRSDLIRYQRDEYEGYQRANLWLAEKLFPLLKPDDIIWVHDYHLIPMAAALRAMGVKNKIGFFLHIPFPTQPILTCIPPSSELLRALSHYDLVGFQTPSDRQAFVDCLTRESGARKLDEDNLQMEDRVVRSGVYPISVYPDEIEDQAHTAASRRHLRRLRQSLLDRKLIISVDRLDYSKGQFERFRAFEKLMEIQPSHRSALSMVQIAPLSRSDIKTYQKIRHDLEGEAGRINGRFGDIDYTPIRYINRNYERSTLMAFFRGAQVGAVTPLRDGMNLVAKEYVAAQHRDDPGVLVLSRFAGAAAEFDGALLVNPYDTLGMAEAMHRALTMPKEERKERHASMLQQLKTNDLGAWWRRFLGDLAV
ncbi:alpha,alpha-trehalose-phosphate synthase (UDP-forming) [Pigmentiphaga litoralis]|uniref:Trehalose-6-phosphate synthase n=1 Tax=Pigmentiphaga litoralis TaxID=516702 RepID=A0A7Y9LLA2_9BURK|nr:alpha,alpha-trehalose-phosphate synthase (UDP-forming) [Pigmentiphaga litoralis]NYE25372.1 trehalose 6-phosphate synthase [Pigmentiphaga litoralis]NYE81015.1 trehalose 6-phosphate synthase [Pigmentiphaga litoralis]